MAPALSTILLSTLAATVSAQAATCDYYSNNLCVKPDASASVTIPFSPLFPTPPTFVYAIDELDATDKKIQEEKDSLSIPSSLTYKGAILKVAWWLQYDNATVNYDRKQNRQYYAFAMETNSSNAIGGDERGCGTLLGGECITNLKDTIKLRTYGASRILGGLGSVLDDLTARPLRNLSCPEDIFGVQNKAGLNVGELQKPLWLSTFGKFAHMTDDGKYEQPLAPGNATFTHSPPQLRFRSLEQQKSKGIIAVTVSWPAKYSSNGAVLNYTMDDVTVEMSCLRLAGGEGDGNGSGGSGGGGSSAGPNTGGGQNLASRNLGGGLALVVAAGLTLVLLAV